MAKTAKHPSACCWNTFAIMCTETNTLSAALKRSVPFFNPCYLGHLIPDALLPGLLAQLIATLYNPNNITPESAPVTLRSELEAGL